MCRRGNTLLGNISVCMVTAIQINHKKKRWFVNINFTNLDNIRNIDIKNTGKSLGCKCEYKYNKK